MKKGWAALIKAIAQKKPNKNKLLYTTCHQKCSAKNLFCKYEENLQENTMAGSGGITPIKKSLNIPLLPL